MGLETFTGKVSDLVETNPAGTSPKSQGDDHLRGIKKTIIGQAIKMQVGQLATAAENHFFDGSAPNELTLKRGTQDAPGVELIKALNGVLSFPNQGQSLALSGYVKLPGGLIVQWGRNGNTNNLGPGWSEIIYPIPFPTGTLQVVGSPFTSPEISFLNRRANLVADSANATRFSWVAYLADGTVDTTVNGSALSWIAIGY